jgi:hypothetical protein
MHSWIQRGYSDRMINAHIQKVEDTYVEVYRRLTEMTSECMGCHKVFDDYANEHEHADCKYIYQLVPDDRQRRPRTRGQKLYRKIKNLNFFDRDL